MTIKSDLDKLVADVKKKTEQNKAASIQQAQAAQTLSQNGMAQPDPLPSQPPK